jgi:hypothetical protein
MFFLLLVIFQQEKNLKPYHIQNSLMLRLIKLGPTKMTKSLKLCQ